MSRCCVHLLRFLRFPAFPAFFAFLFTRNGYARCKYLPSIYLSSLLFLPHISAILNDTSFNPRPLITIPTLAYALVQMVTLTQLCGLKAIGEDIYEVWSARVRNICYLALLPSLKSKVYGQTIISSQRILKKYYCEKKKITSPSLQSTVFENTFNSIEWLLLQVRSLNVWNVRAPWQGVLDPSI